VFEGNLIIYDLDTDETVDLGSFPWATIYSPTGHLLTTDLANRLRAFPFGLERLARADEGFVIAENVEGYSSGISIAADGTLVYVDSPSVNEMRLVWRNRKGEKEGSIGQAQLDIAYPSLSPDGSQVAARGLEQGEDDTDVWVHDVMGNTKSRITFHEGHDSRPIWTPTGREVVYPSARKNGVYNIFLSPIDTAGEERLPTPEPLWGIPNDWSPDGRFLIYQILDQTREDLWLLERSGEGYTSRPFLQTRFHESEAQFSPDGRLVAYESDESGSDEIYITNFPAGDVKQQVSTRGGRDPRWRRDGNELFYVQDETLVSVPISTGARLSIGEPVSLFSNPNLRWPRYHNYDVSSDGSRFVLPEAAVGDANTPRSIRVVQNWFAEFREREQEQRAHIFRAGKIGRTLPDRPHPQASIPHRIAVVLQVKVAAAGVHIAASDSQALDELLQSRVRVVDIDDLFAVQPVLDLRSPRDDPPGVPLADRLRRVL
jgi:hypothetical protein